MNWSGMGIMPIITLVIILMNSMGINTFRKIPVWENEIYLWTIISKGGKFTSDIRDVSKQRILLKERDKPP